MSTNYTVMTGPPGCQDPIMDSSGGKLDRYSDVDIRHGFIRKVFGILTLQLLLTCAICAPFVKYNEAVRAEMNGTAFCVAIVAVLVIKCAAMCYMFCVEDAGRKFPMNYILLSVITVTTGCLTGIITTKFEPTSVLGVAGLTCGIVFCLLIFAVQTKYDFTGWGPYMWCFSIFLLIFSIVCIFVKSEMMFMLKAIAGTLLFSMYIVYDMQLIAGGRHRKYELDVDEYVFGALMLYLDIIELFISLLELFGNKA